MRNRPLLAKRNQQILKDFNRYVTPRRRLAWEEIYKRLSDKYHLQPETIRRIIKQQ